VLTLAAGVELSVVDAAFSLTDRVVDKIEVVTNVAALPLKLSELCGDIFVVFWDSPGSGGFASRGLAPPTSGRSGGAASLPGATCTSVGIDRSLGIVEEGRIGAFVLETWAMTGSTGAPIVRMEIVRVGGSVRVICKTVGITVSPTVMNDVVSIATSFPAHALLIFRPVSCRGTFPSLEVVGESAIPPPAKGSRCSLRCKAVLPNDWT